ncbi:MAG: aminoacyl-tRNA hydrolase [Desulfobacteraceae bacterium]|nr:MAG: aminoacyl-tRNA hydrolase [Desulfobacteraceae bacterium]
MPNDSWMIVGLGNPGREYERTRHNIGFMVIDRLAESCGISLTQKKFDALFGVGKIETLPVILAKPMAYMNRSGPPVQQLAKYYQLESDHILVIHDDIDILFGNLKIKSKGGHGGHNGIKSIIGATGESEFPRIRIGIGRPESHHMDVTNHVLGKFTPDEMQYLEPVLSHAVDAAQLILKKNITICMNQFNRNNRNEAGSDKL